MKRNQREARTAARPQLSIDQYLGTLYGVRATEYGADKYARGNYHGAPPAGVDPVDRLLGYIDAAKRHLGKVAQAINIAKGTGGDLAAACAVVDDDASGGFPPSMLPHLCHAIASLKILVECGVCDRLLPADPGQPWKQHEMYDAVIERRAAGQAPSTHHGKKDVEIRAEQGLPQKDDPDAERRRVLERRAPEQVVSSAPVQDSYLRRHGGERRALGAPAPEHVAEALNAIPKEANAFAEVDLDAEFKKTNPSWPNGVKL